MGEVDGEDGEREDDDDGGGSGGDGDGDDKGIHLQTCMVGLFRFFVMGLTVSSAEKCAKTRPGDFLS